MAAEKKKKHENEIVSFRASPEVVQALEACEDDLRQQDNLRGLDERSLTSLAIKNAILRDAERLKGKKGR
jgi:hypothetical protein